LTKKDLDRVLDVSAFVGRAPQQVEEFVGEHVDPLLERSRRYGTIAKKELTV
jgi:adenylosuccinate lyase